MAADLRYLMRSLRRAPASAVAAIVTLAMTLGAGASIFAVVDAVVLTPPPFAHPETLVTLGEIPLDEFAGAPRAVGFTTFYRWRERASTLAAVEGFDPTNATLTAIGAAERVSATNVTTGFLELLGVRPALGRAFDGNDAGQPVAIVSHGFWRGKLASDRQVIGRRLLLGGQAHTIVGVLPEPFFFALNSCDIWLPLPATASEAARAGVRVRAVARLGRGTSSSSLTSALDEISRGSTPASRVVARPIATAIAGDATRMLGLLSGAAALALVVAFTNLAGLLLLRSIDRERELAVRSALGAGRLAIAKQLMLETQALVAFGVVGGVLLALWTTPVAARLSLEQLGAIANREVAVSWRVVAGVSVVAAACAFVCGLLPAYIATRPNVLDLLRRGATAAPRELALRRALVAGEVAVAFVLLVAMMLVGRSLLNALAAHPGFDARGVITMGVSPPPVAYPNAARLASFYATLQRSLDERLGSGAVAIVDELPLTGDRGRGVVRPRPDGSGPEAVVRVAGTHYFDVMGIPVIAGRGFDARDDGSAPARVVISQSLAARLFDGSRAIGRRLWLGDSAQASEIVGVVGDVRHRALDEVVLPTVYLSTYQSPSRSSHVIVRGTRPGADIVATVQDEVGRLDPDLPVYGWGSMVDTVASSPGLPARRLLTATFVVFATLAIVLGAVGLFGVVAHDVARRQRELALRIALGADPRRLVTETLRQGAFMVATGLCVGGVLSMWAARALRTVLFGADRFDPVSAGVAAVVLVIAGVGAVLPAALRAARTDPMVALRSE